MVDVSNFSPNTVYGTYIDAPLEKVWQVLVDPAFTKPYFFGFAIDITPRTSGTFRLLPPDGSTRVSGEVPEWSPPPRFRGDKRSLSEARVEALQRRRARTQLLLAECVERRVDGGQMAVQVVRIAVDVEQAGDDLAFGGVVQEEAHRGELVVDVVVRIE